MSLGNGYKDFVSFGNLCFRMGVEGWRGGRKEGEGGGGGGEGGGGRGTIAIGESM